MCQRWGGVPGPRCCSQRTRPTITGFTSLHNIIKILVVVAHFLPSVILFALRKVHAPSFLDKSAIPFSKRKRASLSRAKSCRLRSSTQQMVSVQTARLEYGPTWFAPRPNPKSSVSLITRSIPGQFPRFCSTGSNPQASQRQLHARSTPAWGSQWDWSDYFWCSEWKGRPHHRS